jgi:hypothetical protein
VRQKPEAGEHRPDAPRRRVRAGMDEHSAVPLHANLSCARKGRMAWIAGAGASAAIRSLPSLAEPWADTGTSTGRSMLGVLGGLADGERGLIRTRTAESGSRANPKESRWAAPLPAQQKEATRRRAQGATLQELVRQLRPQHSHR